MNQIYARGSFFNNLGLLTLLSLCISIFLGTTQPVHAGKIGYRDSTGTWRIIEETQWPRVMRTVPGAVKKISPIVGKTTFEVTYIDVVNQTGQGFNDPANGSIRQATVEAVLNYISSVLNKTGACQVEFLASEMEANGALAAGGPFFRANGPYEEPFSLKHIITGIDPSTQTPDIQVTVDFGWQWHDSTAPNPGGKMDLYSVLLHEITHGLGLISLSQANGTSAFAPDVVFSPWDNLLYTGNGTKVWNSSGVLAANVSCFTGGDGGLFFRGSETSTVYGSFPGIYAPTAYASGSSIGHWNVGTAGPPVMLYNIPAGTMRRTYAPFEIQALSDIGYNIVIPVSSAGNWQSYQ